MALQLLIHADESCLGNQFKKSANPGGAAGLVEVWKDGAWVRRDYWVSEPDATNNQMALTSAIVPLELLKQGRRLRFFTDSQYLVKGMTEWLHDWKSRGWRRKSGPIENLTLWKRLDHVAAAHQVTWEWVRGHAGQTRNEYADHLAVQAAQNQSTSDGFVESNFDAWLQRERSEGRHLDFNEFAQEP